MTRYDSVRHLLKQAVDAIDADNNLPKEGADAETIAGFRERAQATLTRLDSPGGHGVETQEVAGELFGLLRDCTGPLLAIRPIFEDMVSVTKTMTDDEHLA